MKKLINEQNLKKDRLRAIFLTVLISVVVALLVVKVVIANRLIEDSEKLRQIDKHITALEETNQTLAEQLRAPQSLVTVEIAAQKAGFVKSDRLVFLAPAPSVAYEFHP